MASFSVASLHSWKSSEAIQTVHKHLGVYYCTQISGKTSYKGAESVRKQAFSKIHHCLIYCLLMFNL